jgi:transposase
MSKPLVSDELWTTIAPLLPVEPPKPQGGRPRVPDRAALAGIIFVLRSGIPWELLPQEMGCGSGVTCWRRLRAWHRAGVWARLHQTLLDRLGQADRIDWSRASLDSRYVPAKSNCLGCQGVIARGGGSQATRLRRSALRASKSLCMQAVRATFLGLPAASSRS